MNTYQQAYVQEAEQLFHRFAYSVRTIRRMQGLTQAELAERVGMNKTYMVRLEAGDNNVTLKTALRIASALEVDLLTLIKGVSVEVTPANHTWNVPMQ